MAAAHTQHRSALTLYGRDRELQVVRDLLAAVPTGGSACLIRGAPGAGKSALLGAAELLAQEREMRLLRCRGVESEANLPFAGLHQALYPILDRLDGLPAPQRAALETAFGMREAMPTNDFMVALATLNMLTDVARERPVLWVADDAEWLDEPSAKVVTFVARRLESDPIVLLASVRNESNSPLLDANLPELELLPLSSEAANAVLDASGVSLTPADRRRILLQAAGNPLALVELPRGDAVEGAGLPGTPGSVSLTHRLLQAFVGRIAPLPQPTKETLLVAALNDGATISETMTAAALVIGGEIDIDVLQPAADTGLVDVGLDHISFRHPLIRSAIHEAASLAERRRAHAALGTVLVDDADRRAWHLAASVIGRDEDVANQLEAVATRARQRAAVEVAGAAMARAAELTPDPARRARRLLQAARLAFELGRPDEVRRLLAEARQLDAERSLHWQITALSEAQEEDVAWDAKRVRDLLAEVERAHAAGDREVALELIRAAALRCWWSGRDDEVRGEVTRAAHALLGDAGSPLLLLIQALADPFRNAAAILTAIGTGVASSGSSTETPRVVGTAAAILGAWDVALPRLRKAATRLRTEGRLALVVQMEVTVAFCALMTGDWNGAMGAVSESLHLAEETQQPRWLHASQVAAAAIEGLRGNVDRARELLDEAEPWARQAGSAYVLALASWARGLASLGSDSPEDALVAMHRILDPADPAYHLSVGSWSIADLAEAAFVAGRPDAILDLSVRYTGLVTDAVPPTAAAGLAFAAALAAADEDAEGHFRRAVELSQALPFVQARVRLAYGAWLRRQRRVREAREPLIAAHDVLAQLGAQRWAGRAREELRATGRVRRSAGPERRADAAGVHHRPARVVRSLQPRDWRSPLPLTPHRRLASVPALPQARHHLARAAP